MLPFQDFDSSVSPVNPRPGGCRPGIVLVVVSASFWLQGVPHAVGEAIDIAAVRDAHDEWRRQISSLSYRGEMDGSFLDTPNPVSRRVRRALVAKGESRFAEYQHLVPGRGWTDDLSWTRVYLQPDYLVVHYPVNPYAETSQQAASPSANQKLADVYRDLYLRCCGWWPLDVQQSERRPSAGETSVADVLHAEDVELDPVQREMNGRPCWVVKLKTTDTLDVLWLDCERSCVSIEREYSDSQGRLVLEAHDFREVKAGLWMPTRVRQQVFGRREDASGSTVEYPAAEASLVLSDLDVNAATDADFRFVPAPGTLIRDTDARTTTQIPGGFGVFENILDVARKDMLESSAAHGVSSDRIPWIAATGLWIAAIVVAGLLKRSTRRGRLN